MKLKRTLVISALFAAGSFSGLGQTSVRVSQTNFQGPRAMEDQTKRAAIRDYLQAWQSMRDALEQNRPDLLDRGFTGSAKSDLASTIQEQARLGIHTRYVDRSHNIQLLFYSPEGLSIEFSDDVDYEIQVLDNKRSEAIQLVHMRYIVMLTPSEVRWLVRVLQAQVS